MATIVNDKHKYNEAPNTLIDNGRDLMSALEDQTQFGYSKVTFLDKISRFNISMLPDYNNAAEPYFAFIFMTRPSIRLTDKNLETLQGYPMTSAYTNDYYGYQLLKTISDKSDSVWLPLVTTQAKSYSVTDTEIKTVEKGGTFFGHLLKYGKHSEEHKISNTISIDFRNDRFLSILKMMQIWMGYIYLVSKTELIEPWDMYQKNGVLDYAGSIYYLVTRRDMRELVYWEKLTGVFPIKAPYSIFSYSDSPIIEDNLSIEFSYGIRSDPNDPEVLLDINALTGIPLNEQKQRKAVTINQGANVTNGEFYKSAMRQYGDSLVTYDNMQYPFTHRDVFATHPYITAVKNTQLGAQPSIQYFLHWKNNELDYQNGLKNYQATHKNYTDYNEITSMAKTIAKSIDYGVYETAYDAETTTNNDDAPVLTKDVQEAADTSLTNRKNGNHVPIQNRG